MVAKAMGAAELTFPGAHSRHRKRTMVGRWDIVPAVRRLALFDLDDTLVDRRGAFHTWAQEFAVTYGLDDRWVTWLDLVDAHRSGSMEQFFAAVRDQFALAESVENLWRQYRRRMPELTTCPAVNLAALVELRAAGWRIGIVTNGMADNQLGKIRSTGLATLVDGWCISADVGIRKPDPDIFRLAAQRCGAYAEGGWMVGDSLPLDVTGGHNAGLRTIWVTDPGLASVAREEGPEFFVEHVPEFVVESLPEAAAILLAQ